MIQNKLLSPFSKEDEHQVTRTLGMSCLIKKITIEDILKY